METERQTNTETNARGFGLIELMIVIVILAIMLFGVFVDGKAFWNLAYPDNDTPVEITNTTGTTGTKPDRPGE